jgi:3-oxoacyl-[acyl-carrier protein] reductase
MSLRFEKSGQPNWAAKMLQRREEMSMARRSEFDLTEQVALVTGAGRGIGAAIARSLARAGAHVVVNDLDATSGLHTVSQIVAEGGSAIYLKADISVQSSVESLFEATSQWQNRLDILVCNAGITNSADIFTITREEWESVLTTNLTGTFLCAKFGMELMKQQGSGGRLIFLGSGVAHQGALLGHLAYAASKGAIHSLAKTLARTGAPLKITVNVIAPGLTDTELLRATHTDADILAIEATVPLGIGSPDDIGAAAVYLSSRAAGHVTGITLDVNGGQIIR